MAGSAVLDTAAGGAAETAHTWDPASWSPARRWIIAFSIMLGAILEMLDTSIVNVALPHMQGTFSASVDEVTWVITSYLVANGIMIPMTGWISSRFGRKRYFMFSVTTFVLASAACGAARTLDQIVLFRLLQGLAGAAMQPSSQAILMETFPPEEQQLAMALWGIGMMSAPIAGPTVGGWITDNWSWRWNFYINIPIGIAALIMVQTFLQDPPYLKKRAGGRHVDYLGIALLVVGLGLLQLVLDRGQRADWFESPWVIYSVIISVLCIATLVFNELHFPDPILDLTILKIPTFSLAISVLMAMNFMMFGVNILNPIFYQEFLGYSAWQAGLVMAPRGLCAAASMLLIGQVARMGKSTVPLMSVGLAITAISMWYMAGWNLQVGYWQVMLPASIISFGASMIFPTLSVSTLSCVEQERMGYAASLFSMIRNIGSSFGVSMMSTGLVHYQQVFQAQLTQHLSIFDLWRLGTTPQNFAGAPHLFNPSQPLFYQRSGMAMLYHQIRLQAAMLAFNRIFWLLLLMCLTVLPTLLAVWAWQQSKAVRPTRRGHSAAMAH
jgi:DHA2 family multidrug resistance protein